MAIFQVFLCICGIGLAYGSEADVKAWFLEKAMECSQEHVVTSEEIRMMKEHQLPESNTGKCLLACMFRKAEWLDDKGMFDEDSAYKLSMKEYPDDKEKLENAKKLFALCKQVNDATVSDGSKGCERSSLLATCLMKNAAQLTIHMSEFIEQEYNHDSLGGRRNSPYI
ncbi:unnamed protein product [Leptosia nina]|uniref:Uncharacterized protein n=1 Tax=Leptosia nina TaxID=320188 RepID=A0AAV1J0X2_9NEOP